MNASKTISAPLKPKLDLTVVLPPSNEHLSVYKFFDNINDFNVTRWFQSICLTWYVLVLLTKLVVHGRSKMYAISNT